MPVGMVDILLDPNRHVVLISEIGDDTTHDDYLQTHPGHTIESYATRPDALRTGHRLSADGTQGGIVPLDGIEHEDIDTRWNEAVEWALGAIKESVYYGQYYGLGDRSTYSQTRNLAKVFYGLAYNTVLAATNPMNRLADTRWDALKRNMVTFLELIDIVTEPNITAVNNDFSKFFDEYSVWLVDADNDRITQARTNAGTDEEDTIATGFLEIDVPLRAEPRLGKVEAIAVLGIPLTRVGD